MGPGVNTGGEIKKEGQWYQQQIAQTIAKILGNTFRAEHPIAPAIAPVTGK
jgi:hypothetical protein